MLDKLVWKEKVDPIKWQRNSSTFGTIFKGKNFSYFVIAGGSHMAPYESPLQTLDIISIMTKIANDYTDYRQINYKAFLFIIFLLTCLACFACLKYFSNRNKWARVPTDIEMRDRNE
jgi:hypothetical protein